MPSVKVLEVDLSSKNYDDFSTNGDAAEYTATPATPMPSNKSQRIRNLLRIILSLRIKTICVLFVLFVIMVFYSQKITI
jgi:hypothetical protein